MIPKIDKKEKQTKNKKELYPSISKFILPREMTLVLDLILTLNMTLKLLMVLLSPKKVTLGDLLPQWLVSHHFIPVRAQ